MRLQTDTPVTGPEKNAEAADSGQPAYSPFVINGCCCEEECS